MNKIDLHIHTNLSDGLLSPEDVVKSAVREGCKMISITDHELLNDYSDLESKYEIKIVSGIEFNTSITNLHLLGYGMSDLQGITDEMTRLRLHNEKVCYEVIQRLKEDGFDISVDEILNYLESIKLSSEILDKRKIVKYLMFKGYSDSIIGTYNTLIGANQKYYVPNKKISPQDIIELVKQCNGITILAHPTTLNLCYDDLVEEIQRLQKSGLSGIEIINGKIKNEIFYKYQKIARELGMLETVGSDFHQPDIDRIGIEVDDNIYENIERKLRLIKK
ncbi:MAG TPA: PHP domain-containing protein [Bacilli bacterium]|nr:PHP domain-containing protein [Bacilli bacterium]